MDNDTHNNLINFLNNIDFKQLGLKKRRCLVFGLIIIIVHVVVESCMTEEFCDRIDERDDGRCIICGEEGTEQSPLECAYIVPNDDNPAWADLLTRRLVPKPITCHWYDPRNGILLCHLHHKYFLAHRFFIRWVPQANRFVMINHTRSRTLEPFHGRAVNLSPTSRRVPFHGVFLSHEMAVREECPSQEDREITLPVEWQKWIKPRPADSRHAPDERSSISFVSEMDIVGVDIPLRRDARSLSKLTVANPFDNPDELEALRHSFSEQINWTMAVVESESWDGTAEENILKWKELVNSPPQLHVRKKRRID